MNGQHVNYLQIAGLIGVLLGLWALIKIPGMIFALIKVFFKEMFLIYLWRHFSGAHYHGERRTDATWFRHGSTTKRQYDHGGFMDRWEHKPRGHRALWRWGCTFAFLGACYGLLFDRTVTVHALEALVVYGVVALCFVIEKKIALGVHVRHIETPIVKSLAPVLRLSPHAVRRMLHIDPENVTDEGEVGYIEFPDGITPDDPQRTTMERIIDAHLPVDVELELKLQQQPRIGVIRAGLRPPAEVPWASMVKLMEDCPKGDVILGKDRYKEPCQATFTGLDDPHWGFSVQSGSGKSNFLGIVSAQILHQDADNTVWVIDPKRTSLIDFLGSPYTGKGLKPLIKGVRMANNPMRPEDMRSLISDTYDLMERRALQAETDRTLAFKVHLVVIDELNQFTDIMATYWHEQLAENKAARAGDKTIPELPKMDPMWGQIRAILRMGRFTNIHMVVVAQDLRDDSFGGKGARSYLGFRGLGNYNKKQWDMLVGPDYQLPQKGIGRWIFINAGQKTWVQITRGDDNENYDEIYAYASHGRELHDEKAALALSADGDDVVDGCRDTREITVPILTESTSTSTPDTRRVIVGLREAASYLGMHPRNFENARRRTESDGVPNKIPGEFHQGKSPAWHEEDLLAWKGSRPGNTRKTKLRIVKDEDSA